MLIEELEAKMFKALAHPVRLRVVKELMTEGVCVCDLKSSFQLRQSNLSQHLKILKDAGIVTVQREGLKVCYKLENPEVLKLIDIVDIAIADGIDKVHKQLSI